MFERETETARLKEMREGITTKETDRNRRKDIVRETHKHMKSREEQRERQTDR